MWGAVYLNACWRPMPDVSPPRYWPVSGALADPQHCVCVCRLICMRQGTIAVQQLPARTSSALLWGSHKHLHHFSQYHQHRSYYLESSCQLHNCSWTTTSVGQMKKPECRIARLSLLFLSSTMSTSYFKWKAGIPKEGMHRTQFCCLILYSSVFLSSLTNCH